MRSLIATLVDRAPLSYTPSRISLPWRPLTGAGAQLGQMAANGTVFAMVDKLATGIASLNWHLYRRAPSGLKEDRVEVTNHPALTVLNKPNRHTTRQELFEAGQQHQELAGETWLVIGRDQRFNSPLELWVVRPDRMEPVPHPTKYLTGYIYTSPDGERVPLEVTDVIFMRRPNPLDPYRGLSPIAAALIDLDSAQAAKEWNRNFFRNSAQPGGIVEIDRMLSEAEFNLHRDRWQEQHQGTGNAHRVAILEGGMKWVDRSYSMRDMEFTELRNVSREDLREAFGFPKPLLGAVDDINRANAEAGEYVFGKWLIVPRADRWKWALNDDYLPLFGASATGLEFDYDSPVDEDSATANADRQSRVQAFVALTDAGIDPLDAMEYAGLPAMDLVAAAGTDGTGTASPRDITEMVQKVYLGVGSVITWEEARAILVRAGADLDLSIPQPVPPSPFDPPAGGDEELPPGRRAGAPVARALNAADGDGDLEEQREDWEDRLDDLADRWVSDVLPAAAKELADQITRIVDRGAPADLAAITSNPVPGAELLAEAMLAQADAAGRRTAELAAEQGVAITPATPIPPSSNHTPVVLAIRLRPPKFIAALASDLRAAARVTSGILHSGYAGAAAREALRVWSPSSTGQQVASDVITMLRALSPATLRSDLGAELWASENEGRFSTLELAIAEGLGATGYLADETRDARTCDACAKIDGKRYSSLADAQSDYPFGGYRACDGRSRCRGTIRPVWEARP